MKLSLKYGLMITLGLGAWVIIAHLLVPNPRSAVHTLGAPIFFNLLHFVLIYLGLRALERETGDKPTFKGGLKTGVSISFVYALSAALFFVGVLYFVGTKWLASEAGSDSSPKWRVASQAFAGLFLGAMLLGLIYSTLISFFLAKRRSDQT